MIKYNWDKIFSVTKAEHGSVLMIIHLLTYPRIPRSTSDPTYKYYGQTFDGHSFLLNPKKLLAERSKYTTAECVSYIMMASFRNFNNYKRTGEVTLHMLHNPLTKQIVNDNRLLRYEGDKIHFIFEDNAK